MSEARAKPTLKQYLGDRQTDALRLESLLDVAITCMDGNHSELLFTLIDAAHDEAKALNLALDSTHLPEGGEA